MIKYSFCLLHDSGNHRSPIFVRGFSSGFALQVCHSFSFYLALCVLGSGLFKLFTVLAWLIILLVDGQEV